MVKQLSEDIIRVVVDVPLQRASSKPSDPLCTKADAFVGRSGQNATAAYLQSLQGIDTGGFECILRDIRLSGPVWPSMPGSECCVTGQPIKLPPRARTHCTTRTLSCPPARLAQISPAASAMPRQAAAAGFAKLPVMGRACIASCPVPHLVTDRTASKVAANKAEMVSSSEAIEGEEPAGGDALPGSDWLVQHKQHPLLPICSVCCKEKATRTLTNPYRFAPSRALSSTVQTCRSLSCDKQPARPAGNADYHCNRLKTATAWSVLLTDKEFTRNALQVGSPFT
jgi:hypothetical protein